MSDYRYPAVAALASTFLPRNRESQARQVDGMLAARDAEIAQLGTAVSNSAAAIERYMHENAELRGYIGRVRNLLLDAHHYVGDVDVRYVEFAQAIDRALSLAIPGAGAKPHRPLYHPFKGRVQLCSDCDRPNLCAALKKGTAPCGQNALVDLEVAR